MHTCAPSTRITPFARDNGKNVRGARDNNRVRARARADFQEFAESTRLVRTETRTAKFLFHRFWRLSSRAATAFVAAQDRRAMQIALGASAIRCLSRNYRTPARE